MDLDTSLYMVGKNDWVDALNITREATSRNYDTGITNITSNRKVDYTLPAGTCKVIGAKEDRLRNAIYYFVYNSNNFDSILKYDNSTRTIAKVIENMTDTGSEDILPFDVNSKVNHIDIVHRDEGDLLLWTDGVVAPRKINITRVMSGSYGVLDEQCIEAAKRPPLTQPTVTYGTDDTKTTNTLRRKLFQFKYRFIYDDFEKSTWSPISEVPLPIGTSELIEANNFIAITIETGHKSVVKLEIAARQSEGNVYSDFYSVITMVKADLSIINDSTYQYKFYNDAVYINVDLQESNLLFDYFPLLANAQCKPNGNVIVYGAITEGYDNMNVTDLDVELTSTLVTNTGADGGMLSILYVESPISPTLSNYVITVTGTPVVGTTIQIFIKQPSFFATQLLASYTVLVGDDLHDIAAALYLSAVGNGFSGGPPGPTDEFFTIQAEKLSNITSFIVQPSVAPTSPSTWNWSSKYRFGLVYVDEQGRTPGAQTFVNATTSDNDFEVETGAFTLDVTTPKTPVINAEINHLPPSWAKKYFWVRTKNTAIDSFLMYATCKFEEDAEFYYFCLANVDQWKSDNSNFNYSAAPTAPGTRIKILAEVDTSGYPGTVWSDQDYEILGTVQKDIGSTAYPFIKIKKPTIVPSPVFTDNMLVCLYMPALNAGDDELNLYFEFGQSYDIYEDGGVNYHRGMIQDQTASQPATFTFTNGDVYYRTRQYYLDLTLTPLEVRGSLLMDANYNDYYSSAVNSNGRGFVIEENAKQTYFPALVRFSQEYQAGTSDNGLNRFYYDNQDEYDRSFGDIMKLVVIDQYMKVGQKLKIGSVPIELNIIKTVVGANSVVISDRLLNRIEYYLGEFGVGESPESWVSFNFSHYFCDTNRGVICRLSQDGITPVSVLYNVNSWAIEKLPLRIGGYKIYGGYLPSNNSYQISIEEAGSDPAATLSFNEKNNAFETFLSYLPEMFCTLGTLLVTFKNGELWTHDDTTFNNFYGTQYGSSITGLFNDGISFKKTFTANSQVSNIQWPATEITTSLEQSSSLRSDDYKKLEDGYYAAFLRDSLSPKGLLRGDTLKGNWIKCKFAVDGASATELINMVSSTVKFINSQES